MKKPIPENYGIKYSEINLIRNKCSEAYSIHEFQPSYTLKN